MVALGMVGYGYAGVKSSGLILRWRCCAGRQRIRLPRNFRMIVRRHCHKRILNEDLRGTLLQFFGFGRMPMLTRRYAAFLDNQSAFA